MGAECKIGGKPVYIFKGEDFVLKHPIKCKTPCPSRNGQIAYFWTDTIQSPGQYA